MLWLIAGIVLLVIAIAGGAIVHPALFARRECADVVLDLAEVSFLDSCGLRVLLRARREARRTQTGLRVANPTQAVRRAAEAAGVPEALGVK